MVDTPFLLRPKKYIDTVAKLAKEAERQQQLRKAQNEAEYEKPKSGKSLFGRAIKMAAGFVPDQVEDTVLKPTGKAALKGLDIWGNQVASVPAALFTRGTVQDGQYTTKRNIIGNPLTNVASHVKAQREAGIETGQGIGAGFTAARRAGRAFNQDPDIPVGVKTAAGIAFDPSTFLAAGAISKLPKIAKIGGAKGKLLRAPLQLLEGVNTPGQVAKLAIGAGVGTQLAEKYGIPGLSETEEQIVGGFLGGAGGLAVGKRGVPGIAKDVATFADRAGLVPMGAIPGGAMTDVVDPGERIYHGGPSFIPEGQFLISPKGDIGPGSYWSRDSNIANATVQGDQANVSGFSSDFMKEREARIKAEGGQQVYRMRAKRNLYLLEWQEKLTEVEAARVNDELVKRELEPIANQSLTGQDLVARIRTQTPNIVGVLNSAGFDGTSQSRGSAYPQLAIFRPNEVLESDLTPPTIVKGKGPVPATSLVNKPSELTKNQQSAMETLLLKYPFTQSEAEEYVKLHTDSYGSKIPGHPSVNQYMADIDKAKAEPALQQSLDASLEEMQDFIAANPNHPAVEVANMTLKFASEGQPEYTIQSALDQWNALKNYYPDIEGLISKPTKVKPEWQVGDNIYEGPESSADKAFIHDVYTYTDLLEAVGPENFEGFMKWKLKLDPTKNTGENVGSLYLKFKKSMEEGGGSKSPSWISYLNAEQVEAHIANVSKLLGEPDGAAKYPHLVSELEELKDQQAKLYNESIKTGEPLADPKFVKFYNDVNNEHLTYDQAVEKFYGTDGIKQALADNEKVKQMTFDNPNIGKPQQFPVEPNPSDFGFYQGVHKKYLEMSLAQLEKAVQSSSQNIVLNAYLQDMLEYKKSLIEYYFEGDVPKPNIAKAIQPEDIIGKPQPSIEEWIDKTTTEHPSYEKAAYAAPGEAGAPSPAGTGGAIKLTPSQQAKVKSILAKYPNLNEDEVIKQVKYESMGGGAPPETLVTPKEVTVGLTKGEKISNQLIKVKKAIFSHGIENNELATPVAKEYLRINNIVKNQSTVVGKLAQRAEKILGIKNIEEVSLDNLTPEQATIVKQLQASMDAFDQTLEQFGAKFKDIRQFYDDIKHEQGQEHKTFSDVMVEYGNAVANKVSDKWLAGKLKDLDESLRMIEERDLEAAARNLSDADYDEYIQRLEHTIPGKTVNIAGAGEIKLPAEMADVLRQAVHKVHPPKSPEAFELFNAVNNTLRGMWAAGDASFQFIQMLPTWFDNPKLAAQASKVGFETLKDPTNMAKFILKHDELRYGTDAPTVTEMVQHGGYIAHALGEGTDIGGIAGKIQRVPGYGKFLEKSNTLFTETGNANRIMLWDTLWEQYQSGGASMLTGIYTKAGKGITSGSTRTEVIEAIASAGNRATGYSNKGFGGAYGSALFFAPRFMQSQIETVMKAAWGGGIESQVARRQLLKLIAFGTGLTVLANETRGEETIFDPRDSNFMRIRNVGGADLSIFGPWDTLVKGLVRSVPHIDSNGDFTLGDPSYLLRSKLSPVLSTTADFIAGENVIGQESRDWSLLGNLLLPFSLRKLASDPRDYNKSTAVEAGFGFLGGKGTPLSDTEVLENTLANAGIKKSDPEYLIKRREYIAQHPEIVPEADKGSFKRSQEIQKNISIRRKANDDLALSSGQTLVQFRENRKLLLTEQRNRLDEVIKSDTKKATTQQKAWLNSYFKLFDDKANKNPITDEMLPDKFDAAVASWSNKTENGTAALNFVQRYLGAGLNPVERTYYNDLRKLDAAGYFNLPKYQKMKSDLSEDEIDSLSAQVDSFRVSNPQLQSQPWAVTAKKLLGQATTSAQLLDILHSRKEAYSNPAREKLQQQYGKETLWFNSRADWEAYTNYTPARKVGGALRRVTKPTLK